MTAHIHALDPRAVPVRRLMTVDGERHFAHIVPVLYTSQPRCAWYPNRKRPTWRCKSKPTHLIQMPWLRQADGYPGGLVCEAHIADVLIGRYITRPSLRGEPDEGPGSPRSGLPRSDRRSLPGAGSPSVPGHPAEPERSPCVPVLRGAQSPG